MLLPLLILACVTYILYAVVTAVRERRSRKSGEERSPLPISRFVAGGCVPVAVTATMTYLFLIVGGATTVQLNAGSPSRMNVW